VGRSEDASTELALIALGLLATTGVVYAACVLITQKQKARLCRAFLSSGPIPNPRRAPPAASRKAAQAAPGAWAAGLFFLWSLGRPTAPTLKLGRGHGRLGR